MRCDFDTFLYDDESAGSGSGAGVKRRRDALGVSAPAATTGGAAVARATEAVYARCRSLEGDVLRLTAIMVWLVRCMAAYYPMLPCLATRCSFLLGPLDIHTKGNERMNLLLSKLCIS